MIFCKSNPKKCPYACNKRIKLYVEVAPNPVTGRVWTICFPVSENEHAQDLYKHFDKYERFRGFDIIPDSAYLEYPDD